jgi:hypothetical protein
MIVSNMRLAVVSAGVILTAGFLIVLPPISQDPLYHAFADSRTRFGLPNFWNVITNVAFFCAAACGVRTLGSSTAFIETWERAAFCAILIATAAVGAGSAWYHLRPDDARLYWDRLPMAITFMTWLAMTAGERISLNAGKWILVPSILLGIGSVEYWRSTGDLRPYVVVQFGSLILVPLMLKLPSRYTGGGRMWGVLGLYALAKAAELLDGRIAMVIATGGHPWKHLIAAAAILLYVRTIYVRRVSDSVARDDAATVLTRCG